MSDQNYFTKFLSAVDRGVGFIGLQRSDLLPILLGICFGVTIGLTVIPFTDFYCDEQALGNAGPTPVGPASLANQDYAVPVGNDLGVDLRQMPSDNNDNKVIRKKRAAEAERFVRPRYLSTELGLRQKVIVGVVLSDPSPIGIQRLLRINQTLRHHVDKLIFFANGTTGEINGANQKLRALGITGIVPIEVKISKILESEDSVANHVALRALKYFGDRFSNFFDYYFLSLDRGYVYGRNLMETLKQISINEDVLWGIPRETATPSAGNRACELDYGFVIGRTILTLIGSRLSRCWSSSILRDTHGGNMSRCLEYLVPSNVTCREEIEHQKYKMAPGDLSLPNGTEGIIFAGPIPTGDGIVRAHQTFCRARKLEIDREVKKLRQEMLNVRPKLPEAYRKPSWPLGLPAPPQPKTRFEVNRWTYFTVDTVFFPDAVNVIKEHDAVEKIDIDSILSIASRFLEGNSSNADGSKYRFDSGYKRFSPIRGMDYILDFRNLVTGDLERVEGIRGLTSSIEILPVPFTTEGKRLLFIVPITRANMAQVPSFLSYWFTTHINRQNNTSIIMALVQSLSTNQSSKVLLSPSETSDLRTLITAYNNGSHPYLTLNNITVTRSGAKVAFAVLSLHPTTHVHLGILDHFGRRGLVRPSTLLIFLEPNAQIKDDFFNRIRLKTILGSQVFSPIPFAEFNRGMSRVKGHDPLREIEVDKNTGAFNTQDYRVISFYYSDYLEARRVLGEKVNALVSGVTDPGKTLVEIFVQGSPLFVFRGADPQLILRSVHHTWTPDSCLENFDECTGALWPSRAHLAKVLMDSGIAE